MSKGAMKRLRREAARSGALILPGERSDFLSWEDRKRFADEDRRIADALDRSREHDRGALAALEQMGAIA